MAEATAGLAVETRDRDDAIERLRALTELDSPSGDLPRLARVCDMLELRLRELGATTDRVSSPHGPHLRARFQPAGGVAAPDRIVLLAHYDTVWPAGEAGRRPFTVRDGNAHGPGVYDMKGSLAMLELALTLVERSGRALAHEVDAVIVADEEISSPSGREVVTEAAHGAAAVLALEGPHRDGALKTARRGVATIRLQVAGREAHSGIEASAGISATDELIDQIATVRSALAAIPGLEVNLGIVQGGSRPNVVAGHAHADFGVRISAPAAERALLELLAPRPAIRAGAVVQLELVAMRPIWAGEDDSPLMRHVASVGATCGLELVGRAAPGAGDANFTGSLGIPTIDGLGPVGAGAHALDERISVDSLLERARLLALLLVTPLPPRLAG